MMDDLDLFMKPERIDLFVNGELNKKLVEEKVREIIAVFDCRTDAEVAEHIRNWIQGAGMWLNFVRCESAKTDHGWKYRVTIGKHSVDLPIDIVESLKANRRW